jgi:multiple sugar transport system permease protein
MLIILRVVRLRATRNSLISRIGTNRYETYMGIMRRSLDDRIIRDRRTAYLYLAPAIIAMVFVHLVPMLWGAIISFLNLDIHYLNKWVSAPFVGLANYTDTIRSITASGSDFLNSTKVTMEYVAGMLVGCCILGMTCALTLNVKFRGRNFLRGLMLLPYVTPGIVSAITMRFLFERDSGMVNYILVNLRIISEPMSWLTGPNAIIPLIVTGIWINWPFWFIAILSGLQTIPAELYEAAEIDGASSVSSFFGITLPLLSPVLSILVIVSFLWSFNDFTIANVLFGASPSPSADVLSLHIYKLTFMQWDFGRGSAMAFLVLIMLLLVVLLYFKAFKVGRGTDRS